ncbi:MAG TPA: hypothetical protein VMV53_01790 [Acidimicrobiales bacterium]|nr:hypothetical protein [Acidimicrobiales bacterium]
MSVIAFPRRVDTRPARRRPTTTARPPAHRAGAPRRNAVRSMWRGASAARRSSMVLLLAMGLSLAGSMLVANRQIELHQLQSQLLQAQSSYAEQVGTLTNRAAPGQIAADAGAQHLVDPITVVQVPSTSLDAPLPLPKFSGYAPATSRTIR